MATSIPGTGLPPTATLSKNQTRAMQSGRTMTAQQNHSNITLETQDGVPEAKHSVFIYNICEGWDFAPIAQPPEFPSFGIPKCEKGQKFACKRFPSFVKERYWRPGDGEDIQYYTRNVDGRKYATSLLNPDTFPGTDFQAQLIEGVTGNNDMTGMNLNALGVFWSTTPPDSPLLDGEIKLFRARLDRTMDALVKEGNRLNAKGSLGDITAIMHFAMEYFGLTASWHMSHRHKTECPNCGELILEGIAYHRNASGDDCVIDVERYEAAVRRRTSRVVEPDADDEPPKPVAKPTRRKSAS